MPNEQHRGQSKGAREAGWNYFGLYCVLPMLANAALGIYNRERILEKLAHEFSEAAVSPGPLYSRKPPENSVAPPTHTNHASRGGGAPPPPPPPMPPGGMRIADMPSRISGGPSASIRPAAIPARPPTPAPNIYLSELKDKINQQRAKLEAAGALAGHGVTEEEDSVDWQ